MKNKILKDFFNGSKIIQLMLILKIINKPLTRSLAACETFFHAGVSNDNWERVISSMISSAVRWAVIELNGTSPLNIVYKITPNDHKSHDSS